MQVLLKMMNIYEKTFKHLDGMWSVAYYDFKKSAYFEVDLRPLYYYNNQNGLYFSNSIKALQNYQLRN